eukprot:3686828-Pyramimonas_sp.AAC.1
MEPHHRWRHTRGPISRMLLSLRRVVWKACNFALWEDERGVEISPMYTAPNMSRGMLRDAVQRKHECDMACSLDKFEHTRACTDVARSIVCKSKKYTPRQKLIVDSARYVEAPTVCFTGSGLAPAPKSRKPGPRL